MNHRDATERRRHERTREEEDGVNWRQ
ncbi:uncharacterized protein G2W53_016534 [Senna tora]|uniref:Uncharacterized protein n=1 Tax=Senna tora TaxID=362788 RepID=A0A834TRS9_9FABA|nr:uncharacterized protein G2W53_016534 [Senna tora]